MPLGEVAVISTAVAAFLLWSVAVYLDLETGSDNGRKWVGRIWTSGAIVMAVHVLLAFHVHHQWSHDEAVVATAAQTREVLGVEWGGGLWFNHVLVLVWLADSAWRALDLKSYENRPCHVHAVIHLYLAFMWFNATVVFGSGSRILGVPVFAILALRFIPKIRRKG